MYCYMAVQCQLRVMDNCSAQNAGKTKAHYLPVTLQYKRYAQDVMRRNCSSSYDYTASKKAKGRNEMEHTQLHQATCTLCSACTT